MFLPEGLDFHVDARWQFQLHERVHRLLRRLQYVEQALVGADFKLLPRFLVPVGRPQHAVLVLHRRQRNRSRDLRAGAACRVHDFAYGLIEYAIVVSLQADADSFFTHHSSFSQRSVRGSSTFPRSPLHLLPGLVSGRGHVYRARYKTYAIISLIVPAPTVRPPSRIATLSPFSP